MRELMRDAAFATNISQSWTGAVGGYYGGPNAFTCGRRQTGGGSLLTASCPSGWLAMTVPGRPRRLSARSAALACHRASSWKRVTRCCLPRRHGGTAIPRQVR